jgi:hypothetical protein
MEFLTLLIKIPFSKKIDFKILKGVEKDIKLVQSTKES